MKRFLIILITCLATTVAMSHPGGNMVAAGDYLLWSYVVPFYDNQHHSSVLAYDGETVQTIITSDHPGSDYFLHYENGWVYYVETYNLSNRLYYRILKGKPGEIPGEISGWAEDEWLIGRNGFFVNQEDEIIFCKYPDLFKMNTEGNVVRVYSPQDPAKRLIGLPDGNILLLGDNSVEHVNRTFEKINQWNLELESSEDPPLNRDMVFDAWLSGNDLLVANWGGRSLVKLGKNENEILLKEKPPFTVHWCVEWKGNIYAFSSRIDPPQSIIPILRRVGDNEIIWSADSTD